MRRAERFALIQSQLLLWSLVAVVAYLLGTNIGVALAALLVTPVVVLSASVIWRVAGRQRRSR